MSQRLPHVIREKKANSRCVASSFSRIDISKAFLTKPAAAFPSRTKIVCTLGPNATESQIRELVQNGMNVARLNFSFGDHEFHEKLIRMVRKVVKETRKLCGIMIDTQGPVIRLGKFTDGGVILIKGSTVEITSETGFLGSPERFTMKYGQLASSVNIDQKLIVAGSGGGIHLKVKVIKNSTTILCEVVKAGEVLDGKRVFLRSSSMANVPVVTQTDVQDIMFALNQGVEFLAVSHVKSPKDIESIRKIVHLQGKNVQIFAKIETAEALHCFGDILATADGIVIARGDLGMDIPIEEVTLVQKHITQFCNRVGKPVIIATQLLTSMIKNTQPTRAEATDIVNAVYDGTDCVMLSAETSLGKDPVLVLKTLVDVLREAELSVDYRKTFSILQEQIVGESEQLISESIASSAVKTAFDVQAALVLVVSQAGQMARRIAKYRPHVPVFCLTSDETAAKQCMVTRGVFPVLVGSMTGTDSLIGRTIGVAKKRGMCSIGDRIVIVVSAQGEGSINDSIDDVDHVLKVITVKY